ncbi:MAG: TerC family protein [Phycisphaerales bacterium JB043]
MEDLFTLSALAAFVTLTILEIVLGIDNIVVVAIVADRLPEEQRARARNIGLLLAMVFRIALLFAISAVMRLEQGLFTVFDHEYSGKDLIMIGGGVFLLAKATKELHATVEGEAHGGGGGVGSSFAKAIVTIVAMDAVFSIDSVLTAIGLSDQLPIMVSAIVISVMVMLIFAKRVSLFIARHPTTKVLALAFLLLIGVLLVVDGFGNHVPRGYVYFALGFSVFVEAVNIRMKVRRSLAQEQFERVREESRGGH